MESYSYQNEYPHGDCYLYLEVRDNNGNVASSEFYMIFNNPPDIPISGDNREK